MSGQGKQWCWNSGTGYTGDAKIWKPYLPQAQKDIERAFARRRAYFDLFTAGRSFEMVFKHFDKTDTANRIGVQMSRNGNRAFHFIYPGTDTHLFPPSRGGSRSATTAVGAGGVATVTATPVATVTATPVATVTATPVATVTATPAGGGAQGGSRRPQAVWCWNASNSSDKDNWIAYSQTHQKDIERGNRSPSKQVRIFIKRDPYLVDLVTMTQLNEYTSAMRAIRRTIPTKLLTASTPLQGGTSGSSASSHSTAAPVGGATIGGGNSAGGGSDDKKVTPSSATASSSPAWQWQWNAGNKNHPDWKDYVAEASATIEKGYQAFIGTGRSWSKCKVKFTCAGRSMEVDFDQMGQRTARGFRGVRRLNRGGSSGKGSKYAASGSVARTLAPDASLKTLPTTVDKNLHVGSIVQFELEGRGDLGYSFRRKVKGRVLGGDAKDTSLVVVECIRDGKHYRLRAAAAARSVIPLVGKNDRTAPVDEIEATLSNVKVGDKIRALWKLNDSKEYEATVMALRGKNVASLKYKDGDEKLKCPITWMMPLVSKPFDPSTASFGQAVLLRPRKSSSKHGRSTWELGEFQNVVAAPKVPSGPSGAANRILRLWKGDVTHLKVDAIQNAANAGLWDGSGLCGAIHDAAGPELKRACRKIPVIRKKSAYDYDSSIFGKHDASGDRCDVGDTKVTKGFMLPAKFVLHTVGPKGVKPKELRSAYRSALQQASKVGARSIALCCISTGIYGYPLQQATPVALAAVREWLDEGSNAQNIDAIIFCV
eukprot:g2328.t1